MPYQDNSYNTVYGGTQYEPSRAPGVRDIQRARAIDNSGVMRGINAIAAHVGEFGEVLQKRYKDKRDNENQLALQQIEHERRMELQRRMDLPNGADGGFYDKYGQPDIKAYQNFNEEYIKRAMQTNKGYATPWDKDERDTYLNAYAQKTRQDAEAALVGNVKNRGLKAFNDSYKLYMEQEDYGSAAGAAVQAHKNQLLSDDELQLYLNRCKKNAVRGMARGRSPRTARGLNNTLIDAIWAEHGGSVLDTTGGKPDPEWGDSLTIDVLDNRDSADLMKMPPPQKLTDENDPTQTDVAEPIDPLSDAYTDAIFMGEPREPRIYMGGLGAMSTDEFMDYMRDQQDRAGNMELVPAGSGRLEFVFNDSTPEPFAVMASEAQDTGKITMEEYRKMAYAIANDAVENEDYRGLTKTQLEKHIMTSIGVDGLEDQFFSDSASPAQAMLSMQQEIVENVMSTRNANIGKRIDGILKDRDGLPGVETMLKGIDDEIRALYNNKEVDALAQASDPLLWGARADRRPFAGLIRKYAARYQAEKGITPQEFDGQKIQGFRDWFMEKGPLKELQNDYVNEVKNYLTMVASDKVAEYRRNGGKNWAEEQVIITNAIRDARKNLRGGGEYARYREKKEAENARLAHKYNIEARAAREKLGSMQQEAKEKKEAQKAAEKEQKAADKAAENERKAAERKEKREADKKQEQESNPYRYQHTATLQVKNDGEDKHIITVPRWQYEAICDQLGVTDKEGVVCTFGSSRKEYVVRSGAVDMPTMSTPLFNSLYGKNLSLEQLRKMVRGFNASMKYKKTINLEAK